MNLFMVICFLGLCLGTAVNSSRDHGKDKEEEHENEGHGHAAWSYRGEYYPANWHKLEERCKGSNPRQSPINVEPMISIFNEDLSRIELIEHHNRYRKYNIVNNGHSVNIEIEHKVMVHGGNLPSKGYRIAGIHFHWGSSDDQGSEHTVDEKRFPLEMHMVTYDTERHSELGDAVFGDNSLAVLGTMFKISDDDNPDMEPLLSGLRQVYESGSKGKIRSFPVSRLLPAQTDKYFRYLGSLTTPPCAESVVWTIFLHTQSISSRQLEEFRELVEGNDDDGSAVYIEDNWRPIQLIHKRSVYRSFLFKSEVSRALVNYGAQATKHRSSHSGATVHVLSLTFVALLFAQIL